MKGIGCIYKLCVLFLRAVIYLLIFASAVLGMGFYGLSIGVIGAVLAYTNSAYREWLKDQLGFQVRLSKLPGMTSSSPSTLALSTSFYTVPLSLLCWYIMLGFFVNEDTIMAGAMMGGFGIVILFGWFIKGWGIRATAATLQERSTITTQETQYFDHIRKLDEIHDLDPYAFEGFVGSLFQKLGYQVQTTSLSGDEGIDLILRKEGKLTIVQCKRYENSVGQPIIRDLYGTMIHKRADEAYLVTTGTVTLPAQQWAVGKPIHLVDGNMLINWIDTLEEQTISHPIDTDSDASYDDEDRSGGLITYFQKNPIAAVTIPIALILPYFCCMMGQLIAPTRITPPSTAAPAKSAILTQTPVPSTDTPFPTKTPTPKATNTLTPTPSPIPTVNTSGCTPDATFLADVTIPDDTIFETGQPFTKTWRIRNTGTCDWGAGYTFSYLEGEQMNASDSVTVPTTTSGESTEITVAFVAPAQLGTHRSTWQICTNEIECFGDKVYVQIVSASAEAVTAGSAVTEWEGVHIGMPADTVLKIHPKSETTEPPVVLGHDSRGLIVRWSYPSAYLTFAMRDGEGTDSLGMSICYRVIEIQLR
jgi:hypothetical protein